MKTALALMAFALAAVPADAQEQRPAMTLEQQMMLRCSAVFATIAEEQARGVASAGAYPPMAQRGREFFVRSSARLMEEMNLSREQLRGLLQAEAQALNTGAARAQDRAAYLDSMMRPCLSALEASGL